MPEGAANGGLEERVSLCPVLKIKGLKPFWMLHRDPDPGVATVHPSC